MKSVHIYTWGIGVHGRLHWMSWNRVHRIIMLESPFLWLLDNLNRWPVRVLIVPTCSRVLFFQFDFQFFLLRLLCRNKLEHDLIFSITFGFDLIATFFEFLIEFQIRPICLLSNTSARYHCNFRFLSIFEHWCAIFLRWKLLLDWHGISQETLDIGVDLMSFCLFVCGSFLFARVPFFPYDLGVKRLLHLHSICLL